MKCLIISGFILMSQWGIAQTLPVDDNIKRPAGKTEVWKLSEYSDSVLNELKNLYRLEVKENSPRKYQPERIALVREYLLVYQSIQNSCGVVAYTQKDISLIFGKPDTTITISPTEVQWVYGKLQTKYVRINNLKYRFYFVGKQLEAVKRDDQQ